MYVCVCKGVTDKQIEAAVEAGARRMRCLSRQTGLGTQCGKCCCDAQDILKKHVGDVQTRERLIPLLQTGLPIPA